MLTPRLQQGRWRQRPCLSRKYQLDLRQPKMHIRSGKVPEIL